jgi:1-deoxy-D-xylulose-5-phosphate reductoisomerase
VKGVAIWARPGSIGASALAVLERHPDRFRVVALTAHSSGAELERLVERWKPALAVLSDPDAPSRGPGGTRWASGPEALMEAAAHPDADVVINALVGAAGLEPTLAALGAGSGWRWPTRSRSSAAGPLVLEAAARGWGRADPGGQRAQRHLPVPGRFRRDTRRAADPDRLRRPVPQHAAERLARCAPKTRWSHPTWSMGAKITIDSATLANKALEVIEAHFLFGIGYDRITAVVHPQSIIHSHGGVRGRLGARADGVPDDGDPGSLRAESSRPAVGRGPPVRRGERPAS